MFNGLLFFPITPYGSDGEVDLDELPEDEVQQVGLIKTGDLLAELELVEEDLAGVRRELGDIFRQILGRRGQLCRRRLQLAESFSGSYPEVEGSIAPA